MAVVVQMTGVKFLDGIIWLVFWETELIIYIKMEMEMSV